MNLTEALQQEITVWGRMKQPALMQRFVLRNGRPMEGAPLPPGAKRGAYRACFRNSATLAIMKGYTYVEGFAFPADPELHVLLYHHAWVLDKHGVVVDPTWVHPEKCQYFGVTFTLDTLHEQIASTGYYGLLDHGAMGINHRLMFDMDPGLEQLINQERQAA